MDPELMCTIYHLYKDHSMSADSNSIDIQLVFNNNSADMAKSVFMI